MSTRCKACRTVEDILKLDVEQLVAEQLALETDLASDDLRTNRLSICAECSKRSNHTCTLCGCFIQFRTSLAYKSCPIKKW
ncbi:DUF6171 family protein [Pullulanibacillus sp. KACC 23026]|uniref:DUF6171 family protein n=1 Tax=Pullulanibacillus sp. KACC 23026 TaxID=3028315 RepID=UPI0023AEBC14|nr:DUF6171 family protein [Pullulanibacillus sp. KACC 23026]WEG11888.1 DUF6171 family protein [Pullulanibacillus sp. KACC 23026]